MTDRDKRKKMLSQPHCSYETHVKDNSPLSSGTDDDDFRGFSNVSVKAAVNQHKLMCHDCKQKFTLASLDMDHNVYLTLTTMMNVGARWHCPPCLENPTKTSKPMNINELKDMMQEQLDEITNNFDKKLHKFQSSISNQFLDCQQSSNKVNDSIFTYAKAVSKNLDSQNQTNDVVVELTKKVESINQNVETDLSTKLEIKLKEQKSKNIIIFKIPESKQQIPKDAYQEDFDTVLQIIDPEKTLVDSNIVDLYRRGELQPGNPNPRPVIVKFSSVDLRNQILRIRNPNYTKENTSHKVFIHPDRTKLEQKSHKLLVDQLKKRRQEGETNIFIRSGKIVTIQPFRFKPQSFWGSRQQNTCELSELSTISQAVIEQS